MSNISSYGHFRGRFEIKLDPKGRLSLPSAYKAAVKNTDPSESPQVIVTNARFRGKSCLHVHTIGEWEKLERKIAKLSSLKSEVQAFSRFYLSGGQPVDVDAQGRVLVPQSLRKFAGLDSQVVLVGLGAKFEIWSLDAWNEIYEDLTENFEETLNAIAQLDDQAALDDEDGE